MQNPFQAIGAEYETEIHFQKCYGVMAELFEVHNNMESVIPTEGFKFLDLGCAPGGFSSYLLDDPRCMTGFGVTLPSTSGGFPMRLRRSNFLLQQGDLFEIGVSDLIASGVHICICDAQYLRNEISWDERYRGVRCRSKQHGVWALLLKQFWLGLSRLVTGGILIFRFGWRDPGPDDPATVWYKKMTLRLFSLLHDLFEQVREVKSDYFNALQSSFYVCCSNFSAERFDDRQVAKLLGANFNYLLSTHIQDSNELDILPQVDQIRTEEVDNNISEMLDRINRLRLIHEQSRRWHHQQEQLHEDPRAVVYISPIRPWMTDEALTTAFSVYGRVRRVELDGEHEAMVSLASVEQARIAMTAMRNKSGLGEGVRIWTREEEMEQHVPDAGGQDWPSYSTRGAQPSNEQQASYGQEGYLANGQQQDWPRPYWQPSSGRQPNTEQLQKAAPPGFEQKRVTAAGNTRDAKAGVWRPRHGTSVRSY